MTLSSIHYDYDSWTAPTGGHIHVYVRMCTRVFLGRGGELAGAVVSFWLLLGE